MGRRRHIAFFNVPALGHLFPTLGVVRELVRRGHLVSYTATPDREAYVRAAGARVVPYRSTRPGDTDPDLRAPAREEHVGRSMLNFLTEAEATLPQFEPAFAADPPDLVLFDRIAFAGHLLALAHGVPSIQLWPMMVSAPQWSIGEVVHIDGTHPTLAEFAVRADKFLAERGLAEHGPQLFLTPQVAHHLAFFPREFQYAGDMFGAGYSFVGPCTVPRAGDQPWHPPADGSPVALVSLGTLNNRWPDFYRLVFEAFADTPWHVVLPVGRRLDPADLGPAPANVSVVATVPQLAVLAHAKVFVSHAGMGGLMEGVQAGVPQVAIARTLEQDVNAARVADTGIGAVLDVRTLTPGELRATVDRVAADPQVAAGVAAMRAHVLAAGGAARAADVIEACLPAVEAGGG
ncbi:glycosyltransferase [Catellatospora sp. KI3]|uniref:macrolide family glycosyltransferase n=1 Tax=Catellatospora sp. KI3 TaxID=3041620 RepID=UPI002482FB73|nr:macrolide family glycosyltransferase [Catellatospora sp. KI3]MDI1463172.1 glycosyltransferase [Catellatospora sp. KI3]